MDEFGHIGPYVSRTDAHFKTHPVFGLAGVIIPLEKARELAMFFFKLKSTLLAFEIDRENAHPARWEKKGSSLLTTQNVTKYREVRHAMNRILSWIADNGGHVFYVGVEKEIGPTSESPDRMYHRALIDSIRRIGAVCAGDSYVIVLDEHGKKFRENAVAAAAGFMFTNKGGFKLLEPPMQVESHLYQTVQCADWICALIGRLSAYRASDEFADFEWASRYFGDRVDAVRTKNSRIKKRAIDTFQPTLPTLDPPADL
ncbi:DUF3800 domain-containing protein [Leifsonia sp. Le1]|uniref:DUF3800 domain-containing protein n=1 Tax=Leifsonia sp. Le1 TaxID=3404918 RepID=UPI003EBA1AC9